MFRLASLYGKSIMSGAFRSNLFIARVPQVGGIFNSGLFTARMPQIMRRFVGDVIPVVKPKSILEYLSTSEHCVFSKDVKPWEKFVCATIGIVAGVSGIVVTFCGTAILWYSFTIVCVSVYHMSMNYFEKNYDKYLPNQTSVRSSAFSVLSDWVDDVYNSIPQIVCDITYITTWIAIDALAINTGFVCIKLICEDAVNYFKNIGKMTNCCDVIRSSMKASFSVFTISIYASLIVIPTIIIYIIVDDRIIKMIERRDNK
jgi:hypothetical protein